MVLRLLFSAACLFVLFDSILVSADSIKFSRRDAAIPGAKDSSLFKRYPGSVIFDYEKNELSEYPLLLGAINFEEGEDYETSGYRATKIETVKGQVTRIVYDFPEVNALEDIQKRFNKNLKSNGFAKKFTCEKTACGAATGWQGFLYSQLGENDLRQKYTVASKDGLIVAYYLTEIAGEARAVLDLIKTNNFYFSQNQNAVKEGVFKIFFDIGRAEFDLLQLSNINSFMKSFEEDKVIFKIEGYADAPGDENKNKVLSLARAEQVKRVLQEKFQIPETAFVTKGMGAIVKNNSELKAEYNSEDRRVEIKFTNKDDA